MKRRILSIITALALCLSLCPTWALAAEADPSLCKHHPKHTEDCGYTAPTEGHDCGHDHTEDCYTTDEAGGEVLDCQHSHNSECGYVQADPGAPCGYECRICPIEDLIAALPEQVTEDNAADVRGQLDHILDLYRELDEGKQGQLDLSRCYELQEALDNANAPVQAAEEIDISKNLKNILTAEDGGCPGHTFTGTAQAAMIYVESGVHNVTFSGLNITASAMVGVAPGAAMNLTIEGTNTISAATHCAGIYVPVGATLVINGNGSLNVSGSGGGAGIGGAIYVPDENSSDGDPNCGTVVINGGTITAAGGGTNSASAGIGGATDDDNAGNGGTVTINGGTVTATGGSDNYYGGAGIGGAGGVSNEWYEIVSGNGGTLTINGGTVNLTAGTHDSQYPAYGFGRGSGDASTGTCELTLADASCLTLAEGTTLDPKGTYTINGDPTADMIVVPELVYTGEVLDTSGIKIDDSKTGTGTYFGQTFTVNASADGWTYAINPSEVKAAGDYTVTFSKEGHTSISKTFTVAKSGTQFVGDGEVKTYNGDTLTTSFSAGDTITIKAAPTPTGAAPTNSAMFAASFTAPTAGQMAVFVGDTQVSEAVGVDEDGTYTMTVSAADVLLAAGGPGTEIPLTARFTANDNMADAAGTVKVSITAVAKAEKDGTVIGYYGESGLDAALADKNNEGAVFTLLDNMERETDLKINISCTLDLNGKTIRSTGQYASALYTYYDTTVTIRGEGTVISEQGHGFSVGGTATLEGGTFISGAANCGGVYVQAGKLIVTGEAVVIENTGGGTGLGVGYNAEAQLSGGTYSSIWVDSPHTLAGLLNQEDTSRVAYYKDNTTLVTEGLDGKELGGTVTVKVCDHTGDGVCEYTPNENDASTHTKTCLACGYTETGDCGFEKTADPTADSHTGQCPNCKRDRSGAHSFSDWAGNPVARTCTVCGYEQTAVARVEKDSTTTYVGALADAFTEGNSGATVTLLSEVDLGNNYIGIRGSSTFTLDLNGQTVKASHYGAFDISGGSLTIQDSGTSGKIESSNITIKVTGGTLSIKSGTVSGFYGVQITSGTVNISGGAISGTENGLLVNGGGNIVLSGGAYSGRHAIWVDANVSVTLKDLLATGYAYHQNDIPVAKAVGFVGDDYEEGEVPLDATPAWLTGTVTVKECNHTGGLVPSENGYQHGGPCKCCGSPLDTANHTLGAENKCSGCGAALAAKVEKSGSDTVYVEASGLEAAFAKNSGNDGATITLLDNITTRNQITVGADNLTLDLNGKTYTCTQNDFYLSFVSLTIKGSGAITTSGYYCLAMDGGTLNIESGSFSAKDSAVYVENGGTLQLTGGSFTGNQNAIAFNSGEVTAALANYGGAGAPHYAFYQDSSPYTPSGSRLPSGTFTVGTCEHDGVPVQDLGSGKHGLDCPYCGYHSEHTTTLTATVSGNTVTFRGGCDSCDYRAENLATAAFTIPKLTYGQTGQTVSCTWEHPNRYALMVQIDSGEELQIDVSDTQVSLPLEQLFGSQEINAGNYQLHVYCRSYADVTSNVCSLSFTVEKAPLTPSITGTATKPYDGTTDAPAGLAITLTGVVGSDDVTATASYAYDTANAGTNKTITASGITLGGADAGNYQLSSTTATTTGTITKANVTLTAIPAANTLTYNGTAQALISAGTASVGEVVYSLTETGTYSTTIPTGTDADSYTVWYKVEGTTNYEGTALASVDVTIAQATAPAPQTGTLNVQNGYAREYTYDLNRLLPVLTSGQSFGGEVTYTLKTVNITEAGYYDIDTAAISGTTLTLSVKAVTSSDEGQIGTITVTISSKNFADVDATINVNRVNKQPVSIEGVTAQNGTYNGSTHNGYTGTPTASPYSGGFTVTYATADGTALSGPPTNAGDYTVTFSLDPNDTYTGSRTLSFTVAKASITITADDKRADVGTAKPALTYTVTGLVGSDTLATAPTLACDADMNTIGQYPITASGAAVPSGGNYNTAITYVPGTLSVTDPTIPVTGVTLNKTSLGLTVGGSERLTATITPSDATDKSVTWASSNTAVATVDSSGTVTAVSTGTATITVTTADGAKTATCAVTVRTNSSGGGSYVPSGPGSSTITVPVSGDKSTVHVSASVSGTTATVSRIDTTQIENVIGDNGQASMVEIDFTGLGKTIDTVNLPAAAIKDIAAKAQNKEVGGLTVKLPEAEISFDANALSAIQAQAGSQITLTVTPAKPADLNNRQKEAVGSAPVFDLTLRSSSGAITDFRGGYATVSLPYTLAAGQNPSGVVVYYLDSTGNITPCTTMYDVRSKSAIFTTGHLSLYFVGYDPAAVWVNPFSDVAEGAWYYDAVRFVSENGLMGGYGNGRFGPNDTLTRAQFAQILFNKEGRPVVNYLLQYGDVATGAWYTEAVRWATSQGIVGGYGNGMFGPNDNITREQLAVMLWRYAGSPAATDKELHFTDADKASGYALEALRWAVENGVVNGKSGGILDPKGLATRAEAAQMLKNFLGK